MIILIKKVFLPKKSHKAHTSSLYINYFFSFKLNSLCDRKTCYSVSSLYNIPYKIYEKKTFFSENLFNYVYFCQSTDKTQDLK